MLKKGDVFRQEGSSDLLVAVSDIYPDGSIRSIYRDKKSKKVIYTGINVNDYAIEIYKNVKKLIGEKNTAKLNIDEIMKKVIKHRITYIF